MKNKDIDSQIHEITMRAEKAADGWSGSSNYPFNTTLKRPRRSLSKNDNNKYDEIPFLHVDDAALICTAKHDILFLLTHIDELKKELHSYKFNEKMDEVLNEEKN